MDCGVWWIGVLLTSTTTSVMVSFLRVEGLLVGECAAAFTRASQQVMVP